MDCTTPCVFWLRRLIHFKQIPVVSSIWPSVKCRATLVERSQLPHVSSTHSWVDRSTAFAAWRFLCFSKGLHAIAYADNLNASIASGQGLAGQRYLRLTGTMRKQINPKRQRTLRAMGMSCSGSIVLTCKALNNNHESLACMLNIHELATLVVHGDTIHGENPAPVDMMYIPAHPIKHSNYSIFTIPAGAVNSTGKSNTLFSTQCFVGRKKNMKTEEPANMSSTIYNEDRKYIYSSYVMGHTSQSHVRMTKASLLRVIPP